MFGAESTKESRYPDTIDEESLIELDEPNLNSDPIVTDKHRRKCIIPPSHQPKKFTNNKSSDAAFDTFILSNFALFSGQESVTEWLDATEKKFKHFKIVRNLRLAAIPLLVEGDAKDNYIRNRNKIKSFDDFYELLLVNYETTNPTTYPVEPHFLPSSLHQNTLTQTPSTHKNIPIENQHKTTTHSFDLADHLPPHPILLSTAIVDMGATGPTGDEPEIISTITPPQFPLTSIISPNLTLSIPPTLNQKPSDTNYSNDTDKNSLRFSHESSSYSSLFRRNVSSYPHYHAGKSFSQSNSNKQRSNSNQNYNTSANQPRSRFSYNKNNRQHHANSIVTTNILILFDSKPPSLFSKY